MGDMYGLLFGTHPLAGSLLVALGIPVDQIPRFRDCYPGRNRETGELEIHIFNRVGGANREHYGESEPGERCCCHGCSMQRVSKLPGYLYDRDDEHDSTYATIAFQVPNYIKADFAALLAHHPQLIPPSFKERSEAKLREIREGGPESDRILNDFQRGLGPQLVKLK